MNRTGRQSMFELGFVSAFTHGTLPRLYSADWAEGFEFGEWLISVLGFAEAARQYCPEALRQSAPHSIRAPREAPKRQRLPDANYWPVSYRPEESQVR